MREIELGSCRAGMAWKRPQAGNGEKLENQMDNSPQLDRAKKWHTTQQFKECQHANTSMCANISYRECCQTYHCADAKAQAPHKHSLGKGRPFRPRVLRRCPRGEGPKVEK